MTQATPFAALLTRYDALLIDAYGVLVHAQGALPGAAELIAHLNQEAIPFVLLTNDASRSVASIQARFAGFGMTIPQERIVSSGSLLKTHIEQQGAEGKSYIILGPEDAHAYARAYGIEPVSWTADPMEVQGVVACDDRGFPFLEGVEGSLSLLMERLDQGLDVDLVLPNPDLIYPKDKGVGLTSGSIALLIEEALAIRYPNRSDLRFKRLGKPYRPIFEEAIRKVGTHNVVMVGDQLQTDIVGGNRFGIDTALVQTGLARWTGDVPSDEHRPTWLVTGMDV